MSSLSLWYLHLPFLEIPLRDSPSLTMAQARWAESESETCSVGPTGSTGVFQRRGESTASLFGLFTTISPLGVTGARTLNHRDCNIKPLLCRSRRRVNGELSLNKTGELQSPTSPFPRTIVCLAPRRDPL